MQGYVGRGLLEAREEGEGVNRRFLVSIDSLNALVERRRREADEAANFAVGSPLDDESANTFANTEEGLRHLVGRLEARTEEATELRIRLELTERAQSTLEEELTEANRRREEAERELAELRRQLETREVVEDAPESPQAHYPTQTPPDAGGGAQEATERPWWSRIFGG